MACDFYILEYKNSLFGAILKPHFPLVYLGLDENGRVMSEG